MQFKVEKMGCGGCAKTITNAITKIDPTAQIDIDLATKRVDVVAGLDQATIKQAIRDAGFPAEPIAP